jgi:nuclear receptor coactivator 2
MVIFISDNAAILNILDVIEPSSNSTSGFQHDINERMAISAIQKSLMQCETVVKSPSSPTISLPATPPAYTSTTMSQPGGFPPPPMYPPRPRLNIQTAAQLGIRPAGTMSYSSSQINNQVGLLQF